ncbi:PEP/pyruvate-binding domain-containing protein [Lentimicrobium sp. S6]|uniref:PEP/pyruvate-binding domain-containing protein n=1 Tax=Lentimicrobium sp. S6 TaxID=2735872 RepID=UPI001554969B|nr:PEP/pyruvate-binding domain-containing protein [Lentimicrobium sp. S6]NPD46209.1 pyruvate, phosphate dikinase [Lentimicrobium sp. S6]
MSDKLSHNDIKFPKESKSLKHLKELSCINQIVGVLKENKSLAESLKEIVTLLPQFWQYADYTVARIHFDGENYKSPKFNFSPWKLQKRFSTIKGKLGYVEVYYTAEFMEADQGPFCTEETNLLSIITSKITGFLNSLEAKSKKPDNEHEFISFHREENPKEKKLVTRKLLQRFINKNNYARDIYHDLMPYKVKEILLVANLYDAYSIEKEGRFSEYVLGEYSTLNLTSIPRITGVSSAEDAMEELQKKNYDLVIIMMGTDKFGPVKLSEDIKDIFSFMPVFLLLHNNRDAAYFKGDFPKSFDSVFVWNGESQVFFAMIKMVEDKVNLQNDTQKGMARVILLVEDTPKYYSRYLPMLYNIVMEQTRRIIEDVSTDELYKVLRLRARPKIIHTDNYEEAIEIFNNYKDYMLCLITDVKFYKNAELDDRAGVKLVKYVRKHIEDLPTIIQSSQKENMSEAYLLQASFIDKNSDSLLIDFKNFITHYLGFGDFIFRDMNGRKLAVAKSLRDFEQHLKTIPDESILYHATKNHFSLWLMARGEIQIARIINPSKVNDFKDSKQLRKYLVEVMQRFRNEQNRGKIIPYKTNQIGNAKNIIKLTDGSLGGKGRGLAFLNSLIHNFDFSQILDEINICNPVTYLVGTDEYELFLENNNLHSKLKLVQDYEVIKKIFINGKLSSKLVIKLKEILKETKKPLAIRSSGLFEDSLMQPFAGIFDTFLLPNNHSNDEIRLKQVTDAIKLVYASVYSDIARGYVEAVNYRIEEEKMAIVIQEVVGNQYDDKFYPHFSGVAQSYNYYPIAHMKPEEGFANIAVGLGKYVVDGEKSYRFSPRYPDLENYSSKDLFKNSQTSFYAVNMKERELDLMISDDEGLIKLDISESEKHGTLKHMASVFDQDNNRVVPGIFKPGPRIINFANILKYNYIPLSRALEVILQVGQEAIGSPVEIEFAVDLNRDSDYKTSLYILQIKPLTGNADDYNINMDEEDLDKMLLYTENGLGNGMIDHITDFIYVDLETFDKSETIKMTKEIEALNAKMMKLDKQYVLIGPGRWGTRDPWIGIPVSWPQICNAKIIVETSLANFPLDGSSGSHFFHNVTSADVGYLSVQQELSSNKINWEILDKQKVVERTKYFKHIEFKNPVTIKMDGKKRISIMHYND